MGLQHTQFEQPSHDVRGVACTNLLNAVGYDSIPLPIGKTRYQITLTFWNMPTDCALIVTYKFTG